MPRPRSVVRLTAALAGTAALGLAALVAAPAAHADPSAIAELGVGADLDTSGTDCSVSTGGSDDDGGAATSQGAAVARSVSATGEATKAGADTDDTDLAAAASGSLRLTERAGSLTSLSLGGTLSASVAPDLGASTACSSSAEGDLGMQSYVRLARPAWATITVRTGGRAEFDLEVYDPLNDGGVALSMAGKRIDHTQTVFLDAGWYYLSGGFQVAASSGGPASGSSTVSLAISLQDVGTATGPAAGAGAAYVSLPDARSCDSDQLVPTFTAKAGKARSVAFLVNGRAVRTLKDPSGGGAVVLGGLPDAGALTVTAVVTPDPPKTGKKGKKPKPKPKATVTRSYRGCA